MRLRRLLGLGDTPEAFRLPTRSEVGPLLLYLAAGGLYVLIGVWQTDFLLSWYVAAGYLAVVVWLVPLLVRRLR
jgi:hypothetical protein